MSGTVAGRSHPPAKTREEMLQEWREQRAAKLAATSNSKPTVSNSTALRPVGASFVPGKENRPGSVPPPRHTSDAQPSTDAHPDGFSSLAARLESLKRESLRPSIAPPVSAPSQAGVQFEPVAPVDTTVLRRLAEQLFADDAWKQLYEKGMNAQLTRSKDGATEGTKIKELAGMVKLLRRALKELQGRTESFVEQSCRFERDIGQQVEATKLSSESGSMAAQAELANARREAAAAAAAHKNALAQWKGELDVQQAENARLKRENERSQAEVTRLSGELKRSEAQREAVQESAQRAQRQAASAARDASARQGALERELKQAQAARDALAAESRAEVEQSRSRASEIERGAEQVRQRVRELERTVADLESAHGSATSGLAARDCQIEDLQRRLGEQHSVHERVVADAAAVLNELQDWQTKAAGLSGELERERQSAEASRAGLQRAEAELCGREADVARLAAESAALARRVAAADEAGEAARAEAESNRAESTRLGGELRVAVGAVEALETRVAELETEIANARNEASTSSTRSATLEAELSRETEAHQAAEVRAAEARARLERLETELSALQESTFGLTGGAGDSREMVSRLLTRVGCLEASLAAAESKRRALHNQLVELRGNIRVFCRVRPPSSPRSSVLCGADRSSVRLTAEDGREHEFSFDRVFQPEASQEAVYEQVADLVQSALDGYKVCLFSYGQTGAGKTHTMQGTSQRGPGAGVVPRAVRHILETVGSLREQGWEYRLEATFVEVYNETLRDLLAVGGRGAGKLPELNAIQHQPHGGHTIVNGATRISVESEEDAAELLARAAAARSVESTAMNATSSRSHSVFILDITGRHAAADTALYGSLSLVDLAGSERLARSLAEGTRAKETCSINKSLSALGDVFAALTAKSAHVPYRNSKLTHLLQPCLGGSGKTLMFVNINPDPESSGETACSLRFAAKVNAVDTAAKGGAARHVSSISDPSCPPAKRKAPGAATRLLRPR